jgi:acyl carrier protein
MSRTVRAPRTSLEKELARIWASILQIEEVSIDDDFFALGGDSLLSVHVISRIRDVMDLDVEAARFFAAPTIEEIARHLETLMQTGKSRRPPLTIARAARENWVPASVAQERLWEFQQALPDMPFLNILYALRVMPSVDVAVLERSINEIVRRHEILRTTFACREGRHMQVIAPQLTVPLTFDDLQELPASKKGIAAERLVQDEVLHSFNLAQGPLLKTRLVGLGEREHLLLITMHQVVCDGWSLGVLIEELTAVYDAFSAGQPTPLTPLTIQYADFASWQRKWNSHPEVVSQLTYWREQLHDPLPVMKLGIPRRKRPIDGFRTARREVAFSATLAEAAKRFSREHGSTLFMMLVAAFKTLLHRYVGVEDLRVATLVANRNRPGTQHLIGPLANTVVLRTSLSGDPSPLEVLRRVRSTTLAAFAHQEVPFEELVATLERERALEPAALAQVMILLQNATLRPLATSGHKLGLEEANPSMLLPLVTVTTFDVMLMLRESAHGLVGCCVYKPHLFRATAIDRLLRDFRKVLERMLTEPERPISTIPISQNEKRSVA